MLMGTSLDITVEAADRETGLAASERAVEALGSRGGPALDVAERYGAGPPQPCPGG